MCGIFGMVGERWLGDFDAALEVLAARGPDDRGAWHEAPVHLGHRRLKIIDPRGGHQPIASPDGRWHVVYNGEIYNFRELRRELESAPGLPFATRSDSEVLVRLIAAVGVEAALSRLDGMFAFAAWDEHAGDLWLARDRFGIKPLYYSEAEGLLFASTLGPFMALRGFPRRLDVAAVREYLAQCFIPAPLSILRDVRALEPASWLRYRAGCGIVARGRFWTIPPVTDAPLAFDALVEATDAALAESVRRQLVSDVPIGAFLSGGIDSSLLVWNMVKASSAPVRTFTVRFDQSRRDDESGAARAVAAALGTEHHELVASDLGAAQLEAAIGRMDQPFGDPSFLPMVELCRLARAHITVAIGGDGGDELFGGYERYLRDAGRYPEHAGHRLLRRIAESGLLPAALYRNALRGEARVQRNFSRMGHYPVSPRALQGILEPGAAAAWQLERTMEAWRDSVRRWNGRLDADSLMRADLWHFLAQNGLVKTDRASMMHGLEVRVPMLGQPLVDLILPQPAALKLRGGLKAVLKCLARRSLPRDVWARPKHGFSVPLSSYFRGTWKRYGQDLFASAHELAPFLNAAELRRRWALEQAGRAVDWPLYAVMVLLGWLREHPLEMPHELGEPAARFAGAAEAAARA